MTAPDCVVLEQGIDGSLWLILSNATQAALGLALQLDGPEPGRLEGFWWPLVDFRGFGWRRVA